MEIKLKGSEISACINL